MMKSKSSNPVDAIPTEEFYEEPPRLTVKDSLGVVLALLLLGVIGFVGYIWLTPGLSFTGLLPQRATIESGPAQIAVMAVTADAEEKLLRCESCGMFFEKSPTQVVAGFAVESENKPSVHRFESLGCLFDWMIDNEVTEQPASLEILDYTTFGTDKQVMLEAANAWYLFGTSRLQGSMPPFVAAFETRAAAQAAQPELGGEVVDFAGLSGMWE